MKEVSIKRSGLNFVAGSDFDADGKLQEWVSDSRGFLREKSMCVAKQYSDSFRKLIPFYQTHVPIQVSPIITLSYVSPFQP